MEVEAAIRRVWGDSVTVLLIKVWCLARGITATGVGSMSKLKKCWANKNRTKLVTLLQLRSWQKGEAWKRGNQEPRTESRGLEKTGRRDGFPSSRFK